MNKSRIMWLQVGQCEPVGQCLQVSQCEQSRIMWLQPLCLQGVYTMSMGCKSPCLFTQEQEGAIVAPRGRRKWPVLLVCLWRMLRQQPLLQNGWLR